jgi:drug/metabolite transporter (DMT)-like permease
VLSVFLLAARDLSSRLVPREISSAQLAAWGFIVIVPAGLAMLLLAGRSLVMPEAADVARYGAALVVGSLGYYSLIAATRTGEVSAVVPFRYTRMVFALVLGYLVFGERPDTWMLIGTALVVAAGLYTIWRTALRQRSGEPLQPH